MISRQEFGRVVESFMGELGAICGSQSSADLDQLPGFDKEFREASEILRNPLTDRSVVLTTAFGLIDDFVDVAKHRVLDEAYAFYVDQQRDAAATNA